VGITILLGPICHSTSQEEIEIFGNIQAFIIEVMIKTQIPTSIGKSFHLHAKKPETKKINLIGKTKEHNFC
jgi:hypothetical protein